MSDQPADFHSKMMLRAIRLARRGEGRVEPNPMVGCVIVQAGRVIGEGYHRRFGGPHAEVEAVRRCRESPRGSSVYVTLEPCCHFGKTPPCVDALITAGVAEVVAPLADPNPLTRGRGFRKLRAAGVRVRVGVERTAAADLLAPFATCMRLGRPFVIAKWAQDAAGRMAQPAGQSPWISCEESRRRVHQMRSRIDAIVVGIGTVLRDDPLLTARNVTKGRVPLRVVLDSRLRIPLQCRLVRTVAKAPTLVVCARDAVTSLKATKLRAHGVEVVAARRTRRGGPGLNPSSCMAVLAARGATNVCIEGGPRVLRSFLAAGIVDEISLFVAPLQEHRPSKTPGERRTRGNLLDVLAEIEPFTISAEQSGADKLYTMRLHDPLRLWRLKQCPQAAPPCGG